MFFHVCCGCVISSAPDGHIDRLTFESDAFMTAAVHRRWDFGVPLLSLCVSRNGEWVMASMADGTARLFSASPDVKESRSLALYNASSMSVAADVDAHAFLAGGENGNVHIIDPIISETTLIAEAKGSPILCVASAPRGERRAYGAGKNVYLLDETGKTSGTLPVSSEPVALAFSPDGCCLAVGVSDGVALWPVAQDGTKPTVLELKGSPCALIWKADDGMLLAGMTEGRLSGWRLPEGVPFARNGFLGPVNFLSFTVGEKFVAASGARGILCWQVKEKGIGEQPLVLGEAGERIVTALAPHPKDPLIAAGYGDGLVVLAPLDGRKAMAVGTPNATAVNGLAWNKDGDALFASTKSGTILLFTVESVRKAFVA